MDNVHDDIKKKISVECSTEYIGEKTVTKGILKNEGDGAVVVQELKCLHKNFDGFVIEVDTMSCNIALSSGDSLPFRFPERDRPVNSYTSEVVVSKILAE